MNTQRFSVVLAAGLLALSLSACDRDGPAERAGERIDNAAERAGDKIERAGERVQDAAKDAKN